MNADRYEWGLDGMYPVVLCGKTIPKQYLDECVAAMESYCCALMAGEGTGNTAIIKEAGERRDRAYSRLFGLYGLSRTGATRQEADLLRAVNKYVSAYGVVPKELFSGKFVDSFMRRIRDSPAPANGTAVGWFPDTEIMRSWN